MANRTLPLETRVHFAMCTPFSGKVTTRFERLGPWRVRVAQAPVLKVGPG
jgi:hypothetical protein